MYFPISIKILSLNEEWRFKAITTYQQKELCKVLIVNNDKNLLKFLDNIILNCLDPAFNFCLLSIVDKIFILIKLRSESLGETVEVEIEKEEKKYNTTYSFLNILENFIKAFTDVKPLILNESTFKIKCFLPLIKDEALVYDLLNTDNTTYNDIVSFFIREVEIDNKAVPLSREEIDYLLNNLPAFIYQKILTYVKDTLNLIQTIQIYSYFDNTVMFSFNSIYTDFLKFMFKEDLYGIYQEIYLLNKTGGFNSQYIDDMPPLERQLYVSFIAQEKQQSGIRQAPADTSTIPQNNIDPFDTYMNEMGG
jgi:hypothetical protein